MMQTCGVTITTPALSNRAARAESPAAMPAPAHGPHWTLLVGTPCEWRVCKASPPGLAMRCILLSAGTVFEHPGRHRSPHKGSRMP